MSVSYRTYPYSKGIECRTSDPSLKLGSYRNVLSNRIIKNEQSTHSVRCISPDEQPICKVIHGDQVSTELLLRFLFIDEQQSLRLLSQPQERIGVEVVLDQLANFNQHTRILYYRWRRKTFIWDEPHNCLERIQRWWQYPSNATDQLSAMIYGIEFLLVLQLPSNLQNVNNIDQTLHKVATQLVAESHHLEKIHQYQKKLLNKNYNYQIHSNLSGIRNENCLSDLVTQIRAVKISDGNSSLLACVFNPMEPILQVDMSKFVECDPSIFLNIRKLISTSTARINDSKVFWDEKYLQLMGEAFQNYLKEIYSDYENVLERSKNMIERWEILLMEARRSIWKYWEMSQFCKSDELIDLNEKLERFIVKVKRITRIAGLIKESQSNQIRYIAVSTYEPATGTNLKMICRKLFKEQPKQRILCSRDVLNQQDLKHWGESWENLIKQRNENPDVHLTYVDFSDSHILIDQIKSFSSENDLNDSDDEGIDISEVDTKSQRSLSNASQMTLDITPEESRRSSQSAEVLDVHQPEDFSIDSRRTLMSPSISEINNPAEKQQPVSEELFGRFSGIDYALKPSFKNELPLEDIPDYTFADGEPPIECVNVLLAGESGVGKSTFINALANYLRSSTLDEALTNPTVVIPVSFLITTGFNFDEQVMYFGDCRHRDNENFNDHGQSVTQQCQKYEFDVPIEGGTRRIRIIDTPGFGDTRGIEQDQKNINHIKEYIKRYQTLDAICFLLRPNEARLNIAFRLCFTQFQSLFRESEHRKLFFCFTNARSTFYAPGNTGPLLKKMLTDWHMDHITLTKENTFCFDNESFRYLVAKRNRIDFTGDDHEEYAKSWNVSVKQANNLLKQILNNT